jgi:hypothetical protein
MADPKPFASLSPTLLARKGGARPAMRSQLQPLHHHYRDGAARPVEDDLGWNDMGHDSPDAPDAKPADAEAPVPAAVVALKPSLAVAEPAVPEVVRQQDAIAARVAEPAVSPVPVPVSRSSALKAGRRAAFTLRLDAERHLQLRLACTITNRSAQQIVTEALDQFLASQPDLAGLAAQVGKHR